MPVTLPRDDAAILALIRRWVDLLAESRFAEALDLLVANKFWTPELLDTVIRNYAFIEPRRDGKTFRVTPVASAIGGGPRAEVTWFDDNVDGHVGYAQFDIPLNGEWSDATALFDILAVPDGIQVRLDDVHVL